MNPNLRIPIRPARNRRQTASQLLNGDVTMSNDRDDTTPRPTNALRARWVMALSAGAGALALLLASAASASSATTGTPKRPAVIHLQSTLISATVDSAGLGGPGDIAANLSSFVTSDGTAGHADISCQFFPNNERECTASFVFPNGQIDASAALTNGATTFTAPITGGSGVFEGVSGHIDNTVVDPVTNRTFHLLYPHHG